MMAQFLPSTPNEAHLLQINISLLAENTARTQNEQLYSAWQQSEKDKKQMQTTIYNLNEQLKAMKLEIEKLKLNQKPNEITSLEEINDDGDLAEDTKLARVQNSGEKKEVRRSKITGSIYRK
jgi:DNA repair ATPase RecN